MFEGFEVRKIKTPDKGISSAYINLTRGGKGPPLLLIHGNPLTHVSWHKITPV